MFWPDDGAKWKGKKPTKWIRFILRTHAKSYFTAIHSVIGETFQYHRHRPHDSGKSSVIRISRLETTNVHLKNITGCGCVRRPTLRYLEVKNKMPQFMSNGDEIPFESNLQCLKCCLLKLRWGGGSLYFNIYGLELWPLLFTSHAFLSVSK